MTKTLGTTGLIVRHGTRIHLVVGHDEDGVFSLPLVKKPSKRLQGRIDDNHGNATEYLLDQNVKEVPVQMRILAGKINVFVSPSHMPAAGPHGETGGLRKTLHLHTQADAYYRAILLDQIGQQQQEQAS